MAAPTGYARPVAPTNGRISSWRAHTNRYVPSVEPGTDYYTPIGTPVRAASSGRIVDVGDSIYPATGRYVTIDLDDGRRVRYLHLRNRIVNVGNRVQWGQVIGYSGASGYGEEDWSWNVAETGGAHVHMTLWARQEYKFGRYATLDPELYMATNQGGGGSPATPTITKDEDMDFINVQGKAGSHQAGQFAIYRGNADGKLYARRITKGTLNPMFPTIDNEGLVNLQKAMPFIDLK